MRQDTPCQNHVQISRHPHRHQRLYNSHTERYDALIKSEFDNVQVMSAMMLRLPFIGILRAKDQTADEIRLLSACDWSPKVAETGIVVLDEVLSG